jgi:hypothetical protein
MEATKVICCTCDEFHDIEDTQKLKLNGMTIDMYICNTCLETVPKLDKNVLEQPREWLGISA